MAKHIYVLDTSACLTDGSAIKSFGNHDVGCNFRVAHGSYLYHWIYGERSGVPEVFLVYIAFHFCNVDVSYE